MEVVTGGGIGWEPHFAKCQLLEESIFGLSGLYWWMRKNVKGYCSVLTKHLGFGLYETVEMK